MRFVETAHPSIITLPGGRVLDNIGDMNGNQSNLTMADFADAMRTLKDIMLAPHFSLKEVITTSHSEIDNWPKEPETIQKLQLCCVNIFEKVRAHYGKPVRVNSGYRCPALNAKIGGSTTSQHMGVRQSTSRSTGLPMATSASGSKEISPTTNSSWSSTLWATPTPGGCTARLSLRAIAWRC